MKISTKIITSLFILSVVFSQNVYADYSEKAQVIKFDKSTNDLIVKRKNGQNWLIQHNRSCTSISTEFPVDLIIKADKIAELKVNFNEKCKVYNSAPYNGEGIFVDVIRSKNQLIANHEAEVIWKNNKYLIDYGKGCPYLYDFTGQRIFYHFPEDPSKGGEMIMSNNRGRCPFTFTKILETLEEDADTSYEIKGLMYQEQSNRVYFYWDPVEAEGKWLYAISYSRNPLDLDTYKSWKEMPNVKIMKNNSYTLRGLANGTTYHIYLTTLNEGRISGPWSYVTATPVADKAIKNNPDPDPFQIKLEETDSAFHLSWPLREDARRYYVRFYINGKQEFFKIQKPEQNEITIPKEEKYLNKGLRLEVRTIPLPNKPRFSDGHYWKYEVK